MHLTFSPDKSPSSLVYNMLEYAELLCIAVLLAVISPYPGPYKYLTLVKLLLYYHRTQTLSILLPYLTTPEHFYSHLIHQSYSIMSYIIGLWSFSTRTWRATFSSRDHFDSCHLRLFSSCKHGISRRDQTQSIGFESINIQEGYLTNALTPLIG